MAKVFVSNLDRCNGCYNCQLACKDEHVDNDWTPYAKPQPDTGHFWMRMVEMERGSIPKVRVTYIPTPCMHCDAAPCIPACPVKAIYKRSDGLVIIDPTRCNGCRACIDACPYGAIYFNGALGIAQKCTGCAHIVDGKADIPPEYPLTVPRCVDSCPTEAIRFGEYEELRDLISRAEVLHPEYGTQPRVYYIGLPKPFIAGEVYDPEADEVIEGASVTAVDLSSGATFSTTTDEFGDFWLKNLEWNKVYQLTIVKEGYYPKVLGAVSTTRDTNLGPIPLNKKP
ncbi:MAG: 4Fe-4S dicluster domain-containing protein [Nitrososphaerota archaeon]